MPKIQHLETSGENSLIKFLKELYDKHPGEDRLYVKPLVDIIKEFEEKGPQINKIHKNFIPFKKLEGNKYKDIYELRTKKCRYFIYKDEPNIYVGLHGFEKKSDDTPQNELTKARKEVELWKRTKNKK